MEQPYMLPILYWQYHACWCSGDFRSKSISRHGIEPQSRNIPSPASEELIINLYTPEGPAEPAEMDKQACWF